MFQTPRTFLPLKPTYEPHHRVQRSAHQPLSLLTAHSAALQKEGTLSHYVTQILSSYFSGNWGCWRYRIGPSASTVIPRHWAGQASKSWTPTPCCILCVLLGSCKARSNEGLKRFCSASPVSHMNLMWLDSRPFSITNYFQVAVSENQRSRNQQTSWPNLSTKIGNNPCCPSTFIFFLTSKSTKEPSFSKRIPTANYLSISVKGALRAAGEGILHFQNLTRSSLHQTQDVYFFCISISWVNKTRLVTLCSCQHSTAVLNQGFHLNSSADDFWKFYLTFILNFMPNSSWGVFYDLRKPTGFKKQANLGDGISHVSLNKIHMLRSKKMSR